MSGGGNVVREWPCPSCGGRSSDPSGYCATCKGFAGRCQGGRLEAALRGGPGDPQVIEQPFWRIPCTAWGQVPWVFRRDDGTTITVGLCAGTGSHDEAALAGDAPGLIGARLAPVRPPEWWVRMREGTAGEAR